MYYLAEAFYSVQGEGSRTGIPSVFVRSGLCNFTCTGFGCTLMAPDGEEIVGCDSIRAVSPKFKKNWEPFTQYEDLVEKIDNLIPEYSKHNIIKPDIVFTGGEPLLYWKDDVFQRTLSHYQSRGHQITIETNAALDINFNRKYQEDVIFSMSVKLSNSGEPEHKRINIENITNIIEHCPKSFLKFVVSKNTWESDWIEIKEILNTLPVFATVYLMPMGGTQHELEQNSEFVVNKCIQHGMLYSDRVHIRIWNDKEAV
jgi:organic radical activating enzyme